MMKYVIGVILASMLLVSALNIDPNLDELESASAERELSNQRIKRNTLDCKTKCISLGRSDGSCEKTSWWFISWTCARGWVCTCSGSRGSTGAVFPETNDYTIEITTAQATPDSGAPAVDIDSTVFAAPDTVTPPADPNNTTDDCTNYNCNQSTET